MLKKIILITSLLFLSFSAQAGITDWLVDFATGGSNVVPEDVSGSDVQQQANKAKSEVEQVVNTFRSETFELGTRAIWVAEALIAGLIFFSLILNGIKMVFANGDTSSIAQDLVWLILKAGFFTGVITGVIFSLHDLPEWLAKAGNFIVNGSATAFTMPDVLGSIGTYKDIIWDNTPPGIPGAILAFIAITLVAGSMFYLYYNYIFAILEATLIAVSSVVVLGFGVFEYTKEWAMNQFKYAVGVGLKLMTLAVVVASYPALVNSIMGAITQGGGATSIMFAIMALLVLLGFSIGLPRIMQSALQGHVTDSSGSLSSALKIAAGGAIVGAAAGAASAVGGYQAANSQAVRGAVSGLANFARDTAHNTRGAANFSGAANFATAQASNAMNAVKSGIGSIIPQAGNAPSLSGMGGVNSGSALAPKSSDSSSSESQIKSPVKGIFADITDNQTAKNFKGNESSIGSPMSSSNTDQNYDGKKAGLGAFGSSDADGQDLKSTAKSGLGAFGADSVNNSNGSKLSDNSGLGSFGEDQIKNMGMDNKKSQKPLNSSPVGAQPNRSYANNPRPEPSFTSRMAALGAKMLIDGIAGSAGKNAHGMSRAVESAILNRSVNSQINKQKNAKKEKEDK